MRVSHFRAQSILAVACKKSISMGRDSGKRHHWKSPANPAFIRVAGVPQARLGVQR